MTKQFLLRLSWPHKDLFQNRGAHWAAKARATSTQQAEAWALAKHHAVPDMPNAILEFEWHPPKRGGRKPDPQNMPATVKAAIDGIALAMGCDDAGFRCRFPDHLSEPVKGGCVLITIKESDGAWQAVGDVAARLVAKEVAE